MADKDRQLFLIVMPALFLVIPWMLVSMFLTFPAVDFVTKDLSWSKSPELRKTLEANILSDNSVTWTVANETPATPSVEPLVAQSEDLRIRTEMTVLGIAYMIACIITIWYCINHSICKPIKLELLLFITLAILAALTGIFASVADPFGPIVSQDLYLYGRGLAVSPNNVLDNLPDSNTFSIELLIYVSVGVAGIVILSAIWFLVYNVKNTKSIESLTTRKSQLLTMIALVSITLSLGVAIMHSFLTWGLPVLSESAQKVAEPIAKAGTLYWGGMFGIFTVGSLGWAAYWLYTDIASFAGEETTRANAAAKKEADKVGPDKWKENNGLAFDPLKTVLASVLLLSPFLTSSLLNALGGSSSG